MANESVSVEAGGLIVWLCIYIKLIGVRTRQGRRWLQHFTANNNATLRHNCCRSRKMIWEAAPPVFWPPAVMTFSLLNNPTIIVSFSFGFSERISSLEEVVMRPAVLWGILIAKHFMSCKFCMFSSQVISLKKILI